MFVEDVLKEHVELDASWQLEIDVKPIARLLQRPIVTVDASVFVELVVQPSVPLDQLKHASKLEYWLQRASARCLVRWIFKTLVVATVLEALGQDVKQTARGDQLFSATEYA